VIEGYSKALGSIPSTTKNKVKVTTTPEASIIIFTFGS
jgi:hypothetical protein